MHEQEATISTSHIFQGTACGIQTDVGHTNPPPPVDDSEVTQTYTLFPLQTQHHSPINIVPNIIGQDVSMELDTEAAISVINELTYKAVLAQLPLQKSNVKLHTYSGEQLANYKSLYITINRRHPYH